MGHFNIDRWTKLDCIQTLGDVLLAIAPADADTVDNVSLLGFVSQPASLVWARWARSPVNNV